MLLAVTNNALRESIGECAFFMWWLTILETCDHDETQANIAYARYASRESDELNNFLSVNEACFVHAGRQFDLSKDKANERERTRRDCQTKYSRF
ncbi:MAG: hypothetical protein IJR49_04920 [Treponema sp.]|nr:hypothetical protein [Treponema sp.]